MLKFVTDDNSFKALEKIYEREPEVKQEINDKLRQIIDYFEVGRDRNVVISENIDESSLQFVNMIIDVVMPYNIR